MEEVHILPLPTVPLTLIHTPPPDPQATVHQHIVAAGPHQTFLFMFKMTSAGPK